MGVGLGVAHPGSGKSRGQSAPWVFRPHKESSYLNLAPQTRPGEEGLSLESWAK